MIYIWDNGGDYSSHEVYFIDTFLPFAEIKPILPESGEGVLLGQAVEIEWLGAEPMTLDEVVSIDAFFELFWAPMKPGIEQLYEGGGPKHLHDREEHDRACWDGAKYKVESPARFSQRDPIPEQFAKLTPAVARELLDGWRELVKEPTWLFAFEQECKERGLLR